MRLESNAVLDTETRNAVAENKFADRLEGSATSKPVTSSVPVHIFKLTRSISTVAPLARSSTGTNALLRSDFAHCQIPSARSAMSDAPMSPSFTRNKGTTLLSAEPRPSLDDLPSSKVRAVPPRNDCAKASNVGFACKSAPALRIF